MARQKTANFITKISETSAILQIHKKWKNNNLTDNKPKEWDKALPYNSIPGPQPLPVIGNTWRFFPYVGEFRNMSLLEMHKMFYSKYGNIVVLKGIPMMKDVVVIFSPEDIETLYRNEGALPIRDAFKSFEYYRRKIRSDIYKDKTGFITSQNQDWYSLRTKTNPILMQPGAELQYIDSTNLISNEFLQHVKRLSLRNPSGEMPEDFLDHIRRWTLESIACIALDKRIGGLVPNSEQNTESEMLIKSFLGLFNLFFKMEFQFSLWKLYPTKSWKEFVQLSDNITLTFAKYIKEAQEKSLNQSACEKASKMTIFEQLLKVDRNIALPIAMDLLLGAIDSVGVISGSAMYFLAKNPQAQDKLRQEMRSLLPSKDSPVTKEILDKAAYLKAVIKEVLRIAPNNTGLFRTTTKDMILQGYQIPKGTVVSTTNLFLCSLEKYFTNAREFKPERWLTINQEKMSPKSKHPFVYLPFGIGPRSCIGMRVANLELEIMLAKMIRNFAIEWHYEDMTFNSTPFYGPAKPLKLCFTVIED